LTPLGLIDRLRDGGPARVVALGGGTGLPLVLRGFRELVQRGGIDRLTAVVAMSDDGGSSGRLRKHWRLPPPGDVRNCLVALAEEEDLLAGLFQHRYDDGPELGGHNLGNLILAALAAQTGSFLRAVEVSSRVLRTAGAILPVTLEDVVLEATLANGARLAGETAIGGSRERIRRVALKPADAAPTPGVVEAILGADLIVLGPGSLFTSVLPTLVLDDVAHAMRATEAIRLLVGNLVSERGEAGGLELADHVAVLHEHVGGEVLDGVLCHAGPIDAERLERYRAEGAAPLVAAGDVVAGIPIFRGNLLAAGEKLRHDPATTVRALLEAWLALRSRASRRARQA
jgi:uncharacterized cofD-like protein